MTVVGRYPVDLVCWTRTGISSAAFLYPLCGEGGNKNRKILTATYASVAEAVRNGVFEPTVTNNSDDGWDCVPIPM